MSDPADPSRIGPSRTAIDRSGSFTEALGVIPAAAMRRDDGGFMEPPCSS